ncbi:hypothetical protein H5410_001829 [Solanum commersonii]|uniref:Uncharacterized protein n=1 Tax=Solanum commersonii TaxID=4109 RepID=A0A9J6B058_SOLCO|nr:hypothetical protein H5410_001829 [Solanum commersonii]
MTVERNILYDFVNLVMQKCGYNCQLKDLVMSNIPHFFHNEKVLPFKITDQPSLLVYLGGAERPPILRVYVDENPIEEDHNLEEDQQDMLNDEFDVVDMNNHDAEIGKDEVPDFESNNPPTPIVGSKIPCSSQSSRVNNVLNDEISFYKGMTFKNKEELANSLKIACLKKDFRMKKVINSRNAYDRCEFNDHFNQIRDLVKAAETLERIGFHTWSRAFYPGNRYNIMTSNITESVNSMFDVEGEFPIWKKYIMTYCEEIHPVPPEDSWIVPLDIIEREIPPPYVDSSKPGRRRYKRRYGVGESFPTKKNKKKKMTRSKKNYIESLPRELLIDIVERIASYSLKDLMRVKLRVLNHVANEPSVFKR